MRNTVVHRNRATVGIDLAGEALFKRSLTGGRGPAREFAPLRLDYAAALLCLQARTAASAPLFSPDVPLPSAFTFIDTCVSELE